MSIASRERHATRTTGRAASASDYRADDRESGEFTTDPKAVMPTLPEDRYTAMRGANPEYAALESLWRERDLSYAKSDRVVTDYQAECIRQFRIKEVNDLPVPQRAKAAMKVLAWYPPQHGQGTGADA